MVGPRLRHQMRAAASEGWWWKKEGDVGGRGQGEAHGEITRLGIAKGSNTWEGESRSVRLYAFEVGLSVCVKLCGWGCEWVRVEDSEYTPCGWRAGQNSTTVQSHSQRVTLSPASFMSTTNCFLASVVRPCLIGPLLSSSTHQESKTENASFLHFGQKDLKCILVSV